MVRIRTVLAVILVLCIIIVVVAGGVLFGRFQEKSKSAGDVNARLHNDGRSGVTQSQVVKHSEGDKGTNVVYAN